ncbi:MAG: PTS sugar transporter subunit IIA [Candidatus Omnitrophota bacterium]
MQLTFHDIEKAFEIEERILYQWLNNQGMPALRANDQYYFNSVEVLEWALKKRILLTSGVLKLCENSRHGQDPVSSAIMRGGVYSGLKGSSSGDILDKVLDFLPLPEQVQKNPLKEMLLSRQQAGTTGIGNGIAIPHVKHPVVFAGMDPVIGLFFLEKPVDFSALDGEFVHTLFVILSSSFKEHLSLLSRLVFCLQDEGVKSALSRKVSREEILVAFHVAESKSVRKV